MARWAKSAALIAATAIGFLATQATVAHADLPLYAVTDTIGVGDAVGVAVDEATHQIYTVNVDDRSVSVVDGATRSLIKTI
ncbi:MAG: hypothetical protein JWM76_1193, partial [Pseudonocardiales bacterium]|nr:hypothetical protein [Pseudonocardiales bacterium]